MIYILLDEYLPVKLKYRFLKNSSEFHVSTVNAEKWTGFKDGNLLTKAQHRFDIFVTIDKNLSYKQRISTFSLAVIVLEAKSNRYKDIVGFVEAASGAIKSAEVGNVYKVAAQN